MPYETRTDRVDYSFPEGVNKEQMEALLDILIPNDWNPKGPITSLESGSAYFVSERWIVPQKPIGILNTDRFRERAYNEYYDGIGDYYESD